MPSPLSVKKNDYLTNPKRSDIPTPRWLLRYRYTDYSEIDRLRPKRQQAQSEGEKLNENKATTKGEVA